VPYLGRRLNEFRNKFGVPKGMEYPNLFPGVDVTRLEDGDDSMAYGEYWMLPEWLRNNRSINLNGRLCA
jgi:(S)-2-hydroxy-acid oxidase